MTTRHIAAAFLTTAAFGLMSFSNPASAQEAAPQKQPIQAQPESKGQAAAVSDQKIEAFVVAYLEVDKIRQEYAAKLETTQDAEAKQQLQTEGSKQMVQAVEGSRGISVEEYNSILTAAQSDPALVKRVQEKLQKSAPAQQPATQQ